MLINLSTSVKFGHQITFDLPFIDLDDNISYDISAKYLYIKFKNVLAFNTCIALTCNLVEKSTLNPNQELITMSYAKKYQYLTSKTQIPSKYKLACTDLSRLVFHLYSHELDAYIDFNRSELKVIKLLLEVSPHVGI